MSVVEAVPSTSDMPNVLANLPSPEEHLQASARSTRVTFSRKPSPEILRSLGIKVRDFAYESTLPAIVPVPRVPRQAQPGPEALKRSQRDYDDKESQFKEAGIKRARLERKPTEPVEEPVVPCRLRTLGRIPLKRVCSIITPPSRNGFPASPTIRFSASPPASPLTPPPSHIISQQGPELVQTPSSFPIVACTTMISAPRTSSDSQPLSLHSVIYTKLAPSSSSSSSSRPAAQSPPRAASPVPLLNMLVEPQSPVKETVRKCRGRRVVDMPPRNRYELRQRPVPPLTSRTSVTSNPLGRRRRRRTVKP